MGLFDYVRCDVPLPDRGNTDGKFQTKDFGDPFMEEYRITEAGRLVKVEVRYEDHSDPNAEPETLESIAGCMTPVPTGELTDLNWHGYLEFDNYRAKFTDGQLVGIEVLSAYEDRKARAAGE